MSERRGAAWLVVGALVGAGMAAWGLAGGAGEGAGGALPESVVATVDGRPILRADYERMVAAVAETTKAGVADAALRRRVLDRMVEEELLVRRGVELGLHVRDPRVRTDLGAAVIDHVVAQAEDAAAEPDEAALRSWYDANLGRFRRVTRLRVRHAAFSDGAAAASAARRLRAGEPFDAAVAGGASGVPVPDGMLPTAKLAQYIGPRAVEAAELAEPGEVVGPVEAGELHRVMLVVEREAGEERPFEDARSLVARFMAQERGEQALRAMLDAQRAAAEVVVAEDRL